MIRAATPTELASWNQNVQSNPDGGHIYQSKEWTEFKRINGWEPEYLVYEEPAVVVYFVLQKKPAGLLGNIYYCSKGPGLFTGLMASKETSAHFAEFCMQIKQYLARTDKKAILLKLEPELEEDSVGELNLAKLGLVRSSSDLQFKATIMVDISGSEEEILASFKQKTRYNIRLAERKGVVVEQREMNQEGVDLMYSLMQATQARAGFFLRSKEYFAGYWQGLAKAGMAQLFVATYQGEVIAMVYATVFGTNSYYKDGGSYPVHRNLMAPYLLQWRAMQWAKQQGATTYDLVAVPPRNKLTDTTHHQHGLYQFKRGFNEHVTEFVGCYDLPISMSKFKIWQRQEKVYLKLYAKLKKNLFW